jgi:hypothetical protein
VWEGADVNDLWRIKFITTSQRAIGNVPLMRCSHGNGADGNPRLLVGVRFGVIEVSNLREGEPNLGNNKRDGTKGQEQWS